MGDNVWFLRWLLKERIAPEGADVAIVTTDGRTIARADERYRPYLEVDWDVEYTSGGGCLWATFRDSSTNEYEVSSIQLRRCRPSQPTCTEAAYWVIAVTMWSGLRKRADQILYGRLRFCLESPTPEDIRS